MKRHTVKRCIYYTSLQILQSIKLEVFRQLSLSGLLPCVSCSFQNETLFYDDLFNIFSGFPWIHTRLFTPLNATVHRKWILKARTRTVN